MTTNATALPDFGQVDAAHRETGVAQDLAVGFTQRRVGARAHEHGVGCECDAVAGEVRLFLVAQPDDVRRIPCGDDLGHARVGERSCVQHDGTTGRIKLRIDRVDLAGERLQQVAKPAVLALGGAEHPPVGQRDVEQRERREPGERVAGAREDRAEDRVEPDRLENDPVAAVIETIPTGGTYVLDDVNNPITIYEMPSTHAQDLVLPFVESAGIAFTVDIFSPNFGANPFGAQEVLDAFDAA